jgi:hypothetical protein
VSRNVPKTVRAALLVAVVVAAGATALADDDDPIQSRVFRVNHRSVAGAAEVVSAILSDNGEIEMKFRRNENILLVTDRASILDRVGPLLDSYDTPPRGVDVAVSLIMGTKTEPETGEAGRLMSGSLYAELRGILETLQDFTEYKNYDPLGGGSARGLEGSSMTIDVEGEYRVTFDVGTVEDDNVMFDRVRLERLERDDNGEERARTLYSAEAKVRPGRTLMLGASQGPDSEEALFLALLVHSR